MLTRLVIVLLTAIILAAAFGPLCLAQDFYYDLDTTYAVAPSASKIAVQFDTTQTMRAQSEFFAAHPCLDTSVEATYLHRGFWIYGLQPSYGYEVSAAELHADPAVYRVAPIYITPADSAEFKVSDLVDVQFDLDLSRDAALALLAANRLQYVDSSEYKHNLWECALDDTIEASPLAYGNAMHVLPGVKWACARQYASPVLAGVAVPTDPYYQYQYYLKNTGQNGGTPGIDINVEKAWQIPLTDPSLVVAVIDDGIAPHDELSTLDRLLPGYDFSENHDFAFPGQYKNHGMACAGILAASHSSVGITGVLGTCKVLPVKIFYDNGAGVDPIAVADAIRYAHTMGARVISNSWSYNRTTPLELVANAIRDVANTCGGMTGFGKESGIPPPPLPSPIIVFAAGNGGEGTDFHQCPYDSLRAVHFPANMPEVIAVGAVDNTGARWVYSSYGSELDVMAPSGRVCENQSAASSQWTTDQMSYLGWNPYVTGFGDANGDQNYTSAMGGTSGACPQVAGIAALLLARGHDSIPNCNPGPKIREIITRTATDMGTVGWDQYYGYGRANAYEAMLSIIRGDVDNNAVIDIFDITMLIDVAFSGGQATLDNRTADVNCDGGTDVFDVIYLIGYVLDGGVPPVICYDY